MRHRSTVYSFLTQEKIVCNKQNWLETSKKEWRQVNNKFLEGTQLYIGIGENVQGTSLGTGMSNTLHLCHYCTLHEQWMCLGMQRHNHIIGNNNTYRYICKSHCNHNDLQGGLGTQEEMCFTFLVYYPKIEFSLGASIITEDDFRNYLGTLP